VEAYRALTRTRSELVRQQGARTKSGVFTGSYAINPSNDEWVPIWIADYVLGSYGTGALLRAAAPDLARDEAAGLEAGEDGADGHRGNPEVRGEAGMGRQSRTGCALAGARKSDWCGGREGLVSTHVSC
jgi:hypothetical protein